MKNDEAILPDSLLANAESGNTGENTRKYDPLIDGNLLDVNQTRAMFGGKTSVTLWRWRQRKNDPFPTPLDINGQNYWPQNWLREWAARRTQRAA